MQRIKSFTLSMPILVLLMCAILPLATQSKNNVSMSSDKNVSKLLSDADRMRISNTDAFSENLTLLSQLQRENTFSAQQSCYYQYLVAFDYGYKGLYDDAKKMLNDIFKNCDDAKNKIRSKLLLSNLQVISHDYGPAMNNLDYPISHIDSIDDNELKNRIYSKAALLYRLVEQNDLSLKFADLLLNNDPSEAYYCNGLVAKYRILIKSEQWQEFEKEVNEAIVFCEQNDEYILSNFLRLEWFDLQWQNAKSEAQKMTIYSALKEAGPKIDQLKYQNLISIKDSIYAKVYWSLGQQEMAYQYANQSLMGSKNIGNTKQEIVALQVLVDYYRANGSAEKAINMLIKKNESERTQYSDQQAKTMAYLSIQHENLAKTHQIDVLNQKNIVLSLENELADKAALMQQIIIFSLLALVAFFVMWGVRHKKIQKLYKKLSEHDHMTLIYNRKGLRDFMDVLLPKSSQYEDQVSLSIFDLDLFKNINDQYGHITGDWVIKKVVEVCKELANETITLGRLGGEEFAIVYSGVDTQKMMDYCEQCRIHISEIDSSETGHDFKITASFGITSTNRSGYSYTKMLTDADEAMYMAKNSGRNKVVVFESSLNS